MTSCLTRHAPSVATHAVATCPCLLPALPAVPAHPTPPPLSPPKCLCGRQSSWARTPGPGCLHQRKTVSSCGGYRGCSPNSADCFGCHTHTLQPFAAMSLRSIGKALGRLLLHSLTHSLTGAGAVVVCGVLGADAHLNRVAADGWHKADQDSGQVATALGALQHQAQTQAQHA